MRTLDPSTARHEYRANPAPRPTRSDPASFPQNDTASFQREWARLEHAVTASALPEPKSLFKTLSAWRRELLTFCRTRVTNARTEAANLTAKTFKRIGRGYRNHDNYRCRIIGYAPRPIAA